MRISTAILPEPDRVAMFREVYGRKVMHVEFEPSPDHAFEVDIAIKQFPGLDLLSINRSAMRVSRPKELIGDGDDRVGLQIGTTASSWSQSGCEETLGAGDAILLSNADPGTFMFPTAGVLTTLLIPRNAIAPLLRDRDCGLRCAIPKRTPALRLLTNYLDLLKEDEAIDSPAFQLVAVSHVCDLLALAIGATRDASAVAKGRGLRAARLKAIKADVMRTPPGNKLPVSHLAARHALSIREIERLFHDDGQTFTEFVRNRRLEYAHRILIAPRFAHLRIAEVAYEAGFNDLSYFNRMFRRRYGMSPSDIRAFFDGATTR